MFTLYDYIQIEGIMPERALLRLKRAKIPLYDIEKLQKNQLRLRVRRKDLYKIFSIYPKEGKVYTLSKVEGVGLAKLVDFCKNRIGLCLGALAFCILTLAADTFVFGVDFVGTDVYARETMQALEENGVKLFAPYKAGREDKITAKLLSLDFVEFCSVQKVGGRIRVETRISPFTPSVLSKGIMQAKHTGEIVAITVFRGTALKKIGDTVQRGEGLIGNWFCVEDGGQVCVEPIARVKIACVYEEEHLGVQSPEQAFAEAYLAIDLKEKDVITQTEVTQTADGFHVKINYVVTESMNV